MNTRGIFFFKCFFLNAKLCKLFHRRKTPIPRHIEKHRAYPRCLLQYPWPGRMFLHDSDITGNVGREVGKRSLLKNRVVWIASPVILLNGACTR